jgi:hypothetical protein
MLLSLIINNTTVGTYAAGGFNANKFDSARLKLAQLVSKFEKQSKAIKDDVATVMKIMDKHKAMVKDNTAAAKAIVVEAAGAWDSEAVEEYTENSVPMTFLKKGFEEFDTLSSLVYDNLSLVGLTSTQLNNIVPGSSFESIRVEFFLTDDEEESFGINRFKLMLLHIKSGYRVTKAKVVDGYVYSFNLDMLCPAMNMISVVVSNKTLMGFMLPIIGCYEGEMNSWFNSFLADWKKVKGDAKGAETPVKKESDPLFVLVDM